MLEEQAYIWVDLEKEHLALEILDPTHTVQARHCVVYNTLREGQMRAQCTVVRAVRSLLDARLAHVGSTREARFVYRAGRAGSVD